uniref:t-SNARE coiled-coil homology domain-containing protein n=1 Tax=Ciona savignyi TaxID=51511 RepID=H2YG69_CIOSA
MRQYKYARIVDVEKVRLLILDDDLDDFDLRVHPAKLKVREAVVDFMTNSNKSKNIAASHSAELHSRSPNARDLMSFMQSDGEQHGQLQAQAVCSSQNQQEDAFEQDMEIVHLNNDGLDIEAVERLNQDLIQLHALMNDINTMIHHQAETVDTIADHIEDAAGNVEVGKQQLKKASYLKVAMFPIVGAVIGGVVGGPIGFVAGMKVGSVTGGVAMAGVTGGVLGYQGGKIMKKKHGNEEIPMKELDHQSTMDR